MLPTLLALCLLAEPARIELHYMPAGTPLVLQTGEQVRYFVFDEYKLLLKMDNDLWEANSSLELYKDLDVRYTETFAQKDLIIQSLESDKDVLTGQLKRAEENWHDAEKRLVEASGGPVWPYILAAGGVVVGAVGVTLYLTTLAAR